MSFAFCFFHLYCFWFATVGKASVYNPVVSCYADGKTIVTGPRRDDPNSSGCGGGKEFQCSCQQPWTDSVNAELGYAFAAMTSATEKDNECACYVAEFEGSKPGKINTLLFQVINDGGDVSTDGLDILVPGMGVGANTQGCSLQWKGYDTSSWGNQYGGLDRNAAGCAKLPTPLQHGCLWRMTNWGDSVNMRGHPRRVRCSKALIDRTGCQRKDDAHQPAFGGRHDGCAAAAPDGYTPDSSVCGIGSSSRSTGVSWLPKGHHHQRHGRR